MNRLQKKSLAASLLLHGGLMAAVVFVSGFQPANRPAVALPPIEFVPIITTDLPMSGGGNPNALALPAPPLPVARPAPAPRPATPPPPPPPAPRAREPARPPEPVPDREPAIPARVTRADDSLTPAPTKRPRRRGIDVNDRVTRPAPDAEKKKREELEAKEAERIERARQRAREEAEAREAERQARLEWERQMARKQALIGDLQHFAKSMGENETSTGIAIEIKGPGGGGLPYANFLQGVQHVYEMDWRPRIPQRVLDRGATATATVTIARDGTVVAARLTDSSGSREIDDSVRASLRAVTKTVPLPAGAEENERTVTIDFNVKPKQLRG